jgi:hypothetical protein
VPARLVAYSQVTITQIAKVLVPGNAEPMKATKHNTLR